MKTIGAREAVQIMAERVLCDTCRRRLRIDIDIAHEAPDRCHMHSFCDCAKGAGVSMSRELPDDPEAAWKIVSVKLERLRLLHNGKEEPKIGEWFHKPGDLFVMIPHADDRQGVTPPTAPPTPAEASPPGAATP